MKKMQVKANGWREAEDQLDVLYRMHPREHLEVEVYIKGVLVYKTSYIPKDKKEELFYGNVR